MRICCICVTQDRPEFIPWLQWNFERQTHPDKELLVIDSSKDRRDYAIENSRWHYVDPGTNISAKRNIGLELAAGDAIAWMDDDDWQHPERLERMAAVLEGVSRPTVIGTPFGWFYDLATGRARMHMGRDVLFNSALIPIRTARIFRFDEEILACADTPWMQSILMAAPSRQLSWAAHVWLCHEANVCNPASRKTFDSSDIARRIGENWGWETDGQLNDLRERLGICTCLPRPGSTKRIRTEGCPVHPGPTG